MILHLFIKPLAVMFFAWLAKLGRHNFFGIEHFLHF